MLYENCQNVCYEIFLQILQPPSVIVSLIDVCIHCFPSTSVCSPLAHLWTGSFAAPLVQNSLLRVTGPLLFPVIKPHCTSDPCSPARAARPSPTPLAFSAPLVNTGVCRITFNFEILKYYLLDIQNVINFFEMSQYIL